MARCETCGNEYSKSFQVTMDGKAHTFDCFQCAIHALAPCCGHCGCIIVGHGIEESGVFYCCRHCADTAAPSRAAKKAVVAQETTSRY